MALEACTKMPEEQVAGVKPSVEHLLIFGCNVLTCVPHKTGKVLEANARSAALLRCQSYKKFCMTLENDQAAEMTRHCLST